MKQTVETLVAQGVEHHRRGALEAAAGYYRSALEKSPDHAGANHWLGLVELQCGRPAVAEAPLRRAVAGDPDKALHHASLGEALRGAGKVEEAVAVLTLASRRFFDSPWIWQNLGMALADAKRLGEACEAFAKATPSRLSSAHLHRWGQSLAQMERYPEAIPLLRQAQAMDPENGRMQSDLGHALYECGGVEEAMRWYESAVKRIPEFAPLRYEMARIASLHFNQVDQAVVHLRTIAGREDGLEAYASKLLLMLHYRVADPAAIFNEHAAWGKARDRAAVPPPHAPLDGRRLRVGYVSADFKQHPVACFFEALARHHDKAAVEIFCYSNFPAKEADDTTRRIRSQADHWREIEGVEDSLAADLIRKDQLDILVDLGGHAGGRLGVFARKPAPIQVTAIGYPDTTGLPAMDYRLVDAKTDPPEVADAYASEQLVRLPVSFLCYTPPVEVPLPGAIPLDRNGFVTFGSFNGLIKLSPEWFAMVAAVLKAVPKSQLLVKCDAFNNAEKAHPLLMKSLAPHGIEAGRLRVLTKVKEMAGHLAQYGEVDIALDAFPYHGTTTTCDALWMGVPVVSLAGSIHTSRVGASLLESAGLGDLVAQTQDEFVHKAAQLAQDAPRLRALRAGLRAQMKPLTDGAAYAKRVEDAYRDMVQTAFEARVAAGA